MTRQYEVLRRASLFLEKHRREARVAELLLQHHLNVSRAVFFTKMQEHVPEDILSQFEADIRKHAETGVPIQHVTGNAEFYGRSFFVNENVLIPRMETEELVQHVIKEAENMKQSPVNKNRPLSIIDVGTGSGIIAITLKLELEKASVFAADISVKALKTAKENAEKLQSDVTFVQGDFLLPFMKQDIKADVIVSNPPYIAKQERPMLADTVRDFDPEIALFAGENGLLAFQEIIAQSPSVLNKNGLLVFEIGHEQGKAVRQLIKKVYPNSTVNVIKDINGKDRIVSAKLSAE
ncbi:peptide chain release factor N(5)-glutamine methyltransferase [Virgibacillus sp. YIM 98842]|jgi:release factor glutamine methyltransferase|uniref:peptide chain release factor N(5)-glutamine methyltransferase n=1 Tax=Virgibacillus sp. YIM 98842 TaxID=2663533 RepID=UPI0013D8E2FF|nr:peptide chain release factor N(5)-glutamine methyltransferase [Virgibacillus sp. YIM 98842]